MIDWSLAHRLASLTAGEGDAALPGAVDLDEVAAESERLVAGYTGLVASGPLPAPQTLTRAEWARMNVDALRPVLGPVGERLGDGAGPLAGPLRLGAGAVMGAQVGLMTGYLSQRVLGQYEVALLDPAPTPRLVFVGQNLRGAVGALGVDASELVRWVGLHEVTHALQFAAVPWLRGHLGGLVRELLEQMEVRVDARGLLRLPSLDEVRAWVEQARRDGLVSLVATPAQRAVIDRVQATMAVIEGYSEHVMDAVGEGLLSTLPQLREAMDRRRRSRSAPERLLQKLLGLDLKMRQYEVGKRFCDAVVAAEGIEGLNRVWHGPEAMPTLAELDDPAAWWARTAPRALSPPAEA